MSRTEELFIIVEDIFSRVISDFGCICEGCMGMKAILMMN